MGALCMVTVRWNRWYPAPGISIDKQPYAAISFREEVETGKNYDVYLRGTDGCAARCLQSSG